jgi:hypothetical protein
MPTIFDESPKPRKPIITDLENKDKKRYRKKKSGEALIHSNPMLTIDEALDKLGMGGSGL